MKINRHGSAVWRGGLKDGKGSISTESGALKGYPYGFRQPLRRCARHQSGGADRGCARRLLHDGSFAYPR
jgi:hypothetical protein